MNIDISPASIASIVASLSSLTATVTGVLSLSSIANEQSFLESTKSTLLNYLDILNAYYIQFWMQQEYLYISTINPAAMGLSPTDVLYINNRINSFNYLVQTVYPLQFWLPFNTNNLNNGQPALQSYDLLTYLYNFNEEVPPIGLTLDSLPTMAQNCANAWNDVLTYWQTNSNYSPVAYNAAERMYYSSEDTATIINDVISTAPLLNLNTTQLWNMAVAVPTLLKVSDLLSNDPSTIIGQSINAIRYYILVIIFQLNPILASFYTSNTPTPPPMAEIRSGESLMDFSARVTGDVENWISIADINDLLPPYVGTVQAPNIATPGQNLYLASGPQGNPASNYFTGYLGTDIDLGHINAPLVNWFGDFNTINGFSNLGYALGRRVLTQIGSFIYHTTYGSQLPAQIGAIQVITEVQLLLSYLKSSLLSDPRVNTVPKLAGVPIGQDQAALVASVVPNGPIGKNVPFVLPIVPK